jgi:hypothetical protein
LLKQHDYEIGFKKKPYRARLGIIEIEKPIYISAPQFPNVLLQTPQLQSPQIQPAISNTPPVSVVAPDLHEFVRETYPNGCQYVGYKLGQKRDGHGKYSHPSGSYYDGMWRRGKMEGQGRFFSENEQLIYDGEWRDDDFHGEGTEYNDLVEEQVSHDKYIDEEVQHLHHFSNVSTIGIWPC